MTTNRTALIIVDVQNDFCEGGSLAVAGGSNVAANIASYLNEHANEYTVIVATRDWHNPVGDNGGHFPADGEEPDYISTWPPHCIADTHGAAFHPELKDALHHVDHYVFKGMGQAAYSGFEGVTGNDDLFETLSLARIIDVHIVGIATDYCVKATAIDAASVGYKTTVFLDLCAAVAPASEVEAIKTLLAEGVELAVTRPNERTTLS